MRPGLFGLIRPRAARAVAGLVAAFLLTGNVLAAAGLCVVKAPAPAALTAPAAADEAASVHCPDHFADDAGAPTSGSNRHCPTDDPSAQARSGDLPSPQPMAASAAVLLPWTDLARLPAALLSTDDPSEPRPLYARLQRLRL